MVRSLKKRRNPTALTNFGWMHCLLSIRMITFSPQNYLVKAEFQVLFYRQRIDDNFLDFVSGCLKFNDF